MSLTSIENRDSAYLYKTLEDKLSALNPLNEGGVNDTVWRFQLNNGKVTLDFDFSLFAASHTNFTNQIEIKYGCSEVVVSTQEFAKIIWLNAVCDLAPRSGYYRGSFQVLALIFAFLTQQKIEKLTPHLLTEFYVFCLTQDVVSGGLQLRLSTPSYGNRLGTLTLNKLQKILSQYSTTTVLGGVTIDRLNKSLNQACQLIANMTANTYKEGGSFNYLGLDVGKHYIDHCYNSFEMYYAYASAVHKVIQQCTSSEEEKISKLGLSDKSIKNVLGVILRGGRRDDMTQATRLRQSKFDIIETIAHGIIRKNFPKAERLISSFDIDVIDKIVKRCKFPDRYDTQEFVRSLIFVDFFGEHDKPKSFIWQEYLAVLSSEGTCPDIDLDKFDKIMQQIINGCHLPIPNTKVEFRQLLKQQFERIPKSNNKQMLVGLRLFEMLVKKVSSAGFTCFIGSVGWRANEYMFSISDIKIEKNIDVSDNHYTPYRFHVISEVPKTNGETKLHREITMESYLIAKQVAMLRGTFENGSPFAKSEASVKTAVRHWWVDFVENYTLFNNLEENLISDSYVNELKLLQTKLRHELPIVKLIFSDNPTFGEYLRLYRAGNLTSSEFFEALEGNLSTDTLSKVRDDKYELTDSAVMAVRSEMLGDVAYPTPYAFRHIWAEAVLRRYRGDVGKFIRANFKHIGRQFFMAYLRNKEIKILCKSVQKNFVSSVVREHVLRLDDKHTFYAGGMGRFVKKAINMTNVISQNEYADLVNKISEERIASVQPLPWATCMLRVGSENAAKCSFNRIPQQQNAEPRLCLACTNADISKGNFLGIVVYTKSAIDACRNLRLPYRFKDKNIQAVLTASKCVRDLKNNSDSDEYDQYLSLLEDTLKVLVKQKESG